MVDADMEAVGLVAPGKGKEILENKLSDWNQLAQFSGPGAHGARGSGSHLRRVDGVLDNRRVVVSGGHGFLGPSLLKSLGGRCGSCCATQPDYDLREKSDVLRL